ncbi:MAG: hypothetical protein KF845_10885 [Cyclobacteriaceae bacterium]|nr:hypothetical protein [Cyclobacteriaceae bacterium]
MRYFNRLSPIVIVFILACGKSLPVFEAVNLNDWKADTQGCAGKRSGMEQGIREEKDKLLALNEKQVIQLIGKPDQNELYKRNQKFYTYFITPGPSCETPVGDALRLIVRFNAMGLANEVTVE